MKAVTRKKKELRGLVIQAKRLRLTAKENRKLGRLLARFKPSEELMIKWESQA